MQTLRLGLTQYTGALTLIISAFLMAIDSFIDDHVLIYFILPILMDV